MLSIYNGVPKVIVLGSLEDCPESLRKSTFWMTVGVKDGDGSLKAQHVDAGDETFNAPAAGACVLFDIGQSSADLGDRVEALWRDAGLDVPARVEATGSTDLDTGNVMGALGAALAHENKQLGMDAVALDRQLVVLREDLEDARNQNRRLSRAIKDVVGDQSQLIYERQPESSTISLRAGTRIEQKMPVIGGLLRSLAFYATFAGRNGDAPGNLNARLEAREDGKIIESWKVPLSRLNGWVYCDINAYVPSRYRNVALVLTFEGDDAAAPMVTLARSLGDPQLFVSIDGKAQDGQCLAQKVFIGEPLALSARTLEAGPEDVFGKRSYRQTIPISARDTLRPCVERSLGPWPWLEDQGDAGILVHPTTDGASIAAMDVSWNTAIRGVHTIVNSPNKQAPLIDFSLVLSREPLSPDILDAYATAPVDEPFDFSGKGIADVSHCPWTRLEPGTARGLTLTVHGAEPNGTLYLLTRVPGYSKDYAHAFFRGIFLIGIHD